jgi:bZIP transcription factor
MRHVSSTPSPSFIDPSSLSLPSPPSEAASSPQSHVIDPSLEPTGSTSSSAVPSRKRARTETTPEEKREARAHRNRIAAQNSRDKRKVQFSQLEDKVRALQQENEQLRAQLQEERQRRDGAEKDRENAELKERCISLYYFMHIQLILYQSEITRGRLGSCLESFTKSRSSFLRISQPAKDG